MAQRMCAANRAVPRWPPRVHVVNTNSERDAAERIDAWITRECVRACDRPARDCIVFSHARFAYNGGQMSVLHERAALRDVLVTELEAAAACPQAAPPDACVPPCAHFGLVYGCRAQDFCGFHSREACQEHPSCVFQSNQGCRHKLYA